MPGRRYGVIAAAVVTAIVAIVASLITAGWPDGSSEPVAKSSAGAKSFAPADGAAGVGGGVPGIYHWVYESGTGMTICGFNFPEGETVDVSWVGFGEDGRQLGGPLAFDPDSSARVDETGGFSSIDGNTPQAMPEGTVSVKVYAKSRESAAEAWTEAIGYEAATAVIDRGEPRSDQCPSG